MFRTNLLRSAMLAARPVAALPARRFASSIAMRPVAAVARASAPRVAFGVRSYSAGGGLQKEEVEGRIMSLLQGFDKVSSFFTLSSSFSFFFSPLLPGYRTWGWGWMGEMGV